MFVGILYIVLYDPAAFDGITTNWNDLSFRNGVTIYKMNVQYVCVHYPGLHSLHGYSLFLVLSSEYIANCYHHNRIDYMLHAIMQWELLSLYNVLMDSYYLPT